MFGQTFEAHDLAIIGLLIVLEGVLSIDNALVLALLAKRLPKHQQKRALTYGLAGAFLFRFIAIATAAYLLRWRIVKLFGGAYLIWVAAKHFYHSRREISEEHVEVGPDDTPVLISEATGVELTPEEAEEELRVRTTIHFGRQKHPGFWT